MKIKENIIRVLKENIIFIIVGISVSIAYFWCGIYGDDVFNMKIIRTNNFAEELEVLKKFYLTWSSRLIPKFGCWLFGRYGLWGTYIIVILINILFIYSFSNLVLSGEEDAQKKLVIVSICALFPFEIVTTAGWISTFWVYMVPMVCALYSCLIIKRTQNEKISIRHIFLLVLSTLIATNNELVCGVMAIIFCGIYYCNYKLKIHNKALIIATIIDVMNLVICVKCPGNWNRKTSEIITWFPTYNSYNTLNKIDMGLSNYLSWFFESSKLVFIVLILLLFILVQIRQGRLSGTISFISIIMVLLYGPFKEFGKMIFPYMMCDVDYHYGFFKLLYKGRGAGMLRFIVFFMLIIFIYISIWSLSQTLNSKIINSIMYLACMASEIVLGFSPTVYASGPRVHCFSTVIFMLIIANLLNSNWEYLNNKQKNMTTKIIFSCMVLNIVNWYCYSELMNR